MNNNDVLEGRRPRWADGTPIGSPLVTDDNFEDYQAQEALTELGFDDMEEEEG